MADEVADEFGLAFGEQLGDEFCGEVDAAHGVRDDEGLAGFAVGEVGDVPGVFGFEEFVLAFAFDFDGAVLGGVAEVFVGGV